MIHLMSSGHYLNGLTTFDSDIATGVAGKLRDARVTAREGRCMPPLVRVSGQAFERDDIRENLDYCDTHLYDQAWNNKQCTYKHDEYENSCKYFSDKPNEDVHEVTKFIYLNSTEHTDMDYMLGHKRELGFRDTEKKQFNSNGILNYSKNLIFERKNGYYKFGKKSRTIDFEKLKLHRNKSRMAEYEENPNEHCLEDISEDAETGHIYDSGIASRAYGHTDHLGRPDMTRSMSLQVADDNHERRFMGYRRCHSYTPDEEDGMMDKGKEERAINLSTAGKDTDTDGPITNGDISKTTSLEQDNTSQGYGQGTSQVSSEFTPTQPSVTGSSKRKSRPSNLSASEPSSPVSSGVQSVLMLAAQHGLSPQQMQQLLQHHQGALPQQLNQLMQQQQSFVIQQQQQKAQEQLLLQLNEQLQLNVLQQSQLLQQQDKNKSSSGGKQIQQTMQQLAVQQQALVQQIQQIQLQQRQFLLACLAQQPFGAPQGVLSPAEIQQLWKDAAEPSTEEMKGLNGVTPGQLHPALLGLNGISHEGFPFAGHLIGQPQVNLTNEEEKTFSPLYRHKLCKWPGCDKYCEDTQAFTKHLNVEHTLDDRNTAQARVQMQVVSQLEIQLSREKELLHAMMQHLHLKPLRDREERENRAAEKAAMTSPKMTSPVGSPSKPPSLPVSSPKPNLPSVTMATMTPVTSGLPIVSGLPSAASLPVTSGLPPLVIPPHSQSMTSVSQPPTPQSQSQPATPTGLGPIRRRVSDKCNLPISAEIQRNREFYKNTDVRPPFTYASLIRQAIIESENKQLTLNEVYQWFQSTFAYFRRNEATWKNAVRHNLSLHKCFMRVENVKGAVWTVDEIEFYKRRPQKLTGGMSNSPLTPEASIYGDTINASLRAALEHSSMLMNQQITLSNGSLSDTAAEDLSMKSYNSSNDSFSKSDSPGRDEIFMKQEHLGLHEEVVGGASPLSNLSSHGNPSPRDLRRSPNPRHLSPTAQESPIMKYMDKNGSEDIGRFTEMETEHEALDMQIKNHQSEALDMSHDPGMKLKAAVCTKDELENRRNVSDSAEMESPDLEETIRKEFSLRVEEDDERRAQIAETAREIELLRKASNGVSPHSPRELDHFSANQDPYSHLLHPSSATAVSHSITS